jgi:hypothetical protein
MDRNRNPSVSGSLLQVIGVAVLSNLVFLALLAAMPVNPSRIADRVRTAFETGELGTSDYLPRDWRRGWHQYNDCVVLQMLSNENLSRIDGALAPVIYVTNEDWSGQCATLRQLVMEDVDRKSLMEDRYARYWHGYLLPTTLALQVMELRDVRRILGWGVWLAVVVLLGVALRAGTYTRLTGSFIALAALSIWAVPFFAPSLTHGPGDALLILMLAGFIVLSSRFNDFHAPVIFASAFGCAVIYFEMTTGQLPVAAVWLIVLTLAVGRDRMGVGDWEVPYLVLTTTLAFGFGAMVTILTKQVIASLFVETGVSNQFLSHLRFYMEIPDSEEGWPGILVPFGRLIRKSHVLTFYNETAGYGLLWGAAVVWIIAILRGLRQWSRRQARADLLILVVAALIPAIWVFLLPRHTYNHAVFMVRMLVAPISLAPIALHWFGIQSKSSHRDDDHVKT